MTHFPWIFAAISMGVSSVAATAHAGENQATDSLYACAGYYNLFSMIPDVNSIRKVGEQKRSLAYKLIMKVEGKSFANPNDLSRNVERAFMNKADPDTFVQDTIEVDKSCLATFDEYTAALSTGADVTSIEPSAAFAILDEAKRASEDAKRAYVERRDERRKNMSAETIKLIEDLAECAGYFTALLGSEYVNAAPIGELATWGHKATDTYADYYDISRQQVAAATIQAQMKYARMEMQNPIGFPRSTQTISLNCGKTIGAARRNIADGAL